MDSGKLERAACLDMMAGDGKMTKKEKEAALAMELGRGFDATETIGRGLWKALKVRRVVLAPDDVSVRGALRLQFACILLRALRARCARAAAAPSARAGAACARSCHHPALRPLRAATVRPAAPRPASHPDIHRPAHAPRSSGSPLSPPHTIAPFLRPAPRAPRSRLKKSARGTSSITRYASVP